MVEEARQLEETTPFGDANAFFKLYNTSKAAVFFFENADDDTLEAKFELALDNL